MAIAERQSISLRALVREVSNDMAAERLPVMDMSRATALEHDSTISHGIVRPESPASEIRRLEGPIRERAVIRHAGDSPIRYFLDGTQKTLPVWRVGTTPVIASVTAAAILHRTGPAEISIVPDTLVARITWILPRFTHDATLNRMVDLLEGMGGRIHDPLESRYRDDPEHYRQLAGSYTHVLEQGYSAANTLRSQAEADLLQLWVRTISPYDPDGWIVVDGPLLTDTPNAIGLVKNTQAQHLHGQEAAALYDLPVGQRTSAYTLVSSEHREGAERALWYLRMQNSTGQDARHGLIRLESPAVLADLDQIDPISSWILAERAPRASNDPRWATLLYPIHLLERILKRRINALTAGWPT